MQAADREKMFNRRHSLNLPEQLPGHYSRKATERTQKASSKVCSKSWKIAGKSIENSNIYISKQTEYENANAVGATVHA
jgi:hypothetical protein